MMDTKHQNVISIDRFHDGAVDHIQQPQVHNMHQTPSDLTWMEIANSHQRTSGNSPVENQDCNWNVENKQI